MKILLAGGGTAGHINPALAIADCIKAHHPEAEIAFVGNADSMEERIISRTDYKFYTMKVRGFQRSFSPQNIKRNVQALWYLATSPQKCKQILDDFKPDLVIGTGGYVSGPIVQAAAGRKIKTAVHEQNAYPGITNKLLSSKVNVTLLAVDQAQKFMDERANCVVVGNPVRAGVLKADRAQSRAMLGYNEGDFVVLSFGGSLGAQRVNEAAGDLIAHTLLKFDNVYHIHAYGGRGKETFEGKLAEYDVELDNEKLDIREYINDMDVCLAAADLVISRAGAITLSELQAAGKAAVLIPSPYVSENHQYHNAMVLQNQGSAIVIEEKDLTAGLLCEVVDSFITDPEKTAQYGKNARDNAITDAAERIYTICMDLLG